MRQVLKWLGIGAGSIAGLAVLAGAGIYGIGVQRIGRTHDVKPATLTIPDDSASIERGRHMARAIAKCHECHGNNFEGAVFIEDPAFGRLAGPNVTPAGVVAGYTDEDWVRAVRHGVKRDGRSVVVMPSYEFAHMSDEDLAAVIAYMKTLPPVEHTPPRMRLGPMAYVLIAANMFPVLSAEAVQHDAIWPAAIDVALTPEYGQYLASIGCVGCHGATLQGGAPPVNGPDISPAGRTAGWNEDDFRLALRAGKRPDGSIISTEMPWNLTAAMSDLEIAAVWAYLQTLQPAGSVAKRME